MMRVIVSCQHMDLTPTLRDHAETKVSKACSHLDSAPPKCKVHLSLENHANTSVAEIVLNHYGQNFVARAENDSDMYAAIDAASNRLRRQLDDFNNKQNHHR